MAKLPGDPQSTHIVHKGNEIMKRLSALQNLFARVRGFVVAPTMTAVFLLLGSTHSFAQKPPPKLDSGDTAWILTSTALVLMMTEVVPVV